MSNSDRFATRPLAEGGTPVAVWTAAKHPLPQLDLAGCPDMVIVAPHPDDETLGLGATAAMLAALGVGVQVVSVCDGGAAFPGLSPAERDRLESVRRTELHRAMDVLGLPEPICLGLPDGEIAQHEAQLAGLLGEILMTRPAGTWCAATWRGDGHPDHEAVGRAAATAVCATGAVLLEYPVWMWHWADPGDPAVPWHRAHAVPLSDAAVVRKQAAAQCFPSQFEGIDPLLPAVVLPRLLAVGEVVFR